MALRGLLLVMVLVLSAGCGSQHLVAPAGAGVVRAADPRAAGAVQTADAVTLRAGNAAFAGRLLALLARAQPTVALSPFSISEALSMTFAGARGATASQIAGALDFGLPAPRLFAAFNTAGQALAAVNGPEVTLDVADALYGQRGERFRQAFLGVLARDYGTGMRIVDFQAAADAARAAINAWVSERTHGRISKLLGPGDVDPSTRLVLVNAVYLKAKWLLAFDKQATFPAVFHSPGGAVEVPTMHQTGTFGYLRGAGYRALELPYRGGRLAFDILLPNRGQLQLLLSSLTSKSPLRLLRGLGPQRVQLALPKLRLRTRFELADALKALGMPLAFEPGRADLSGIGGQPGDLHIKAVVHEAYIRVDEAGTEAAAATGVTISPTAIAAPPAIRFVVDRPFAFVLRDTATGAILFMGVVSHP